MDKEIPILIFLGIKKLSEPISHDIKLTNLFSSYKDQNRSLREKNYLHCTVNFAVALMLPSKFSALQVYWPSSPGLTS